MNKGRGIIVARNRKTGQIELPFRNELFYNSPGDIGTEQFLQHAAYQYDADWELNYFVASQEQALAGLKNSAMDGLKNVAKQLSGAS